MGLFIEIKVSPDAAKDPATVKKLSEVCPVGIFTAGGNGELEIVDANVDECTLCELCLGVGAAGSVQVLKLYDGNQPLERSR